MRFNNLNFVTINLLVLSFSKEPKTSSFLTAKQEPKNSRDWPQIRGLVITWSSWVSAETRALDMF